VKTQEGNLVKTQKIQEGNLLLTQTFFYDILLTGFVTGVTQITVGKQIHKLPNAWAEYLTTLPFLYSRTESSQFYGWRKKL